LRPSPARRPTPDAHPIVGFGGSIFRKSGKRVVIANHPGDIPTGTLREICRQAGWEWPPKA